MTVTAIIPAREASTRFPGKPLAKILDRPMIQWVYERCRAIDGITSIHVATDSANIAAAVEQFGGSALMTSIQHRSGTDRLAEAAIILNLRGSDVVLNVQGDQPALNPRHPSLLIEALMDEPELMMATLAVPFPDPSEIADPNHVKVVMDHSGSALYFSRAPIPWPRDGGPGHYFKHVGLYAYRVDFLRQFVSWPQGKLEAVEKLEQLRALEQGHRIKVLIAEGLSPEVDLPEDIAKVEAVLRSAP
ncbi:MAG: 3-deoxy-manno-octulosonate cytidylyltransferase [Deltaproteobacteria bacterium]|nr:3-deoxy-manno-octulosonate cytidylyltransferase [Deltaproteobacteria bacterium]